MNHYHCLRNDLARHPASDFDAFRADAAEAVNVGLAIDDDVPGADTAGNFARVVDRRGVVAMQIASESALN